MSSIKNDFWEHFDPAPAVTQNLSMLLLRLRETLLQELRPILQSHGLTDQSARVLIILSEVDSLDMIILAKACCISPINLSRVILKLEARGFLTRSSFSIEAFYSCVALTDSGKKFAIELRTTLRGTYGELKHRMDKARVERLTEDLKAAISLLGSPVVADD